MGRRSRRGSFITNVAIGLLVVAVVRACGEPDAVPEEAGDDIAAIERDLTPADAAAVREGIAALVVMDVSGSMRNAVADGGDQRRKIDVARRAALVLIRQFHAYAQTHPDEPVVVGLFEFSDLDGPPVSREVIPLSPADPDRAEAALARMEAGGGTPIGDAMIAAKRTLDGSGLARRHLLVVTDGENTSGYAPAAVMTALQRRPEAERPSVYFVAFDVAEARFADVRDAGALVLGAGNADELNTTLDALLTGKILVEGP